MRRARITRVEPPARLELTTYGLQIRRSTSCSYEGISLSRWNSQDSNLGHYSSSHLSYCSMLPG